MSIGRVLLCIGTLLFTIMARGQAPGVHLGDLSWPDAERRYRETPIVIVPFGAGAKEHGPHMPMNADRAVMDYLVNAAIESRDVIVAAPVVGCPYGSETDQFSGLVWLNCCHGSHPGFARAG